MSSATIRLVADIVRSVCGMPEDEYLGVMSPESWRECAMMAKREHDDMRAEIEKLKAERDEARKIASGHRDSLRVAEKQRDEAQKDRDSHAERWRFLCLTTLGLPEVVDFVGVRDAIAAARKSASMRAGVEAAIEHALANRWASENWNLIVKLRAYAATLPESGGVPFTEDDARLLRCVAFTPWGSALWTAASVADLASRIEAFLGAR